MERSFIAPSLGLGALTILVSLFSASTRAYAESLAAEPVVPLKGTRPTQVDLSRVSQAPRDLRLHLEIFFALRNRAEMERLGEDLENPASPRYHHWLSQEEAHARFGPTAQEFRAVNDWLVNQGFTITQKNYGKLVDWIRFTGTAAQAERAFVTLIVSLGADRYANTTDILIPERFKDVIGSVLGLDNLGAIYIPQWRLRDRNSNFLDWLRSPH